MYNSGSAADFNSSRFDTAELFGLLDPHDVVCVTGFKKLSYFLSQYDRECSKHTQSKHSRHGQIKHISITPSITPMVVPMTSAVMGELLRYIDNYLCKDPGSVTHYFLYSTQYISHMEAFIHSTPHKHQMTF